VNALPFVRSEDREIVGYWHPAADANHHDGIAYGNAAVAALAADGCDSRLLEGIFEALISDGIKRRVAGGKGSRATLNAVSDGFLRALAQCVCEAAAITAKGGAA
jgi:hypothetical protein